MTENNLTTKEFWSKNRDQVSIEFPEAAPIKQWMENTLPLQGEQIKSCFEVGCHPGRFLAMFGRFQVELNGIDYAPATKNIRSVLIENNFTVGEIFIGDFLDFKSERQYDCVCSFGFIEHFKNWDEIILRHLALINKGGYLVLEVPNYRGIFQRIPRYLFDRENFKIHNLESMDLDRWERILNQQGFEVVSKKYFDTQCVYQSFDTNILASVW
jgi:SAM-dependent methyltransferase